MEVKVRRIGIFEDIFIEPLTLVKYSESPVLKEFIDFLADHYGEPLRQRLLGDSFSSSEIVILLNGRSISSLKKNIMTPISDGDEVVFTVMFTGG